jgi:hypothetical protein
LRDLDHGTERITDPAELAAVQQQARRVRNRTLTTAALLTLAYLLAT